MKSIVIAGVVVLVAVVVRIAYLESFDPWFVNVDQYGDIAESLARGEGYTILSSDDIATEKVDPPVRYPTAKRTPGFPLFVAGIYGVFGERPRVALYVQALLDGLVVVLTFLLARQVLASPWSAGIVSLGYALYPPELHMVVRLWSEPLFTVLLVGGTLVGLTVRRRGSPGLAFAAGLIRGAGILVRPGLLLFTLVEAPWIAGGAPGRRLPRAAAYGFGLLVALAPWLARNAQTFDGAPRLTTFTGYNLYVGHDPSHAGRYYTYTELPVDLRAALRGKSEPEQDRILFEAAIERIRDNDLATTLRLAGLKVLRFFTHVDRKTERPTGKSLLTNGLLLLFAAVGVRTLVRRGPDGLAHLYCLAAPIAYFLALHTATVSRMRFLFPLLPYLLILAVVGFRTVWRPRDRSLYDPPL